MKDLDEFGTEVLAVKPLSHREFQETRPAKAVFHLKE
jgi:hypothetical protein